MLDRRKKELESWTFKKLGVTLLAESIGNDASFRRYFRATQGEHTYIMVDAPVAKEPIAPFIKVGEVLSAGGVRTPKIFAFDEGNGFMLLEDFGNKSFLDVQIKCFDQNLYERAIDVIIAIENTDPRKFITHFDRALFNEEAELFCRWYSKCKQEGELAQVFELLWKVFKTQDMRPAHKDFHARNLMLLPSGEIGVIDFQDALIAPRGYDLVSLLKDAYFQLDDASYAALVRYYLKQSGRVESERCFIQSIDFLSVQRHLKILGIFNRLWERDGKAQYQQNIPLVKAYLMKMCRRYPQLNPLSPYLCGQ